jgi:hypothetical protein
VRRQINNNRVFSALIDAICDIHYNCDILNL